MKILITGGAGFIGSYLSNFLVKTGHIVTVVDNFIRGQSDRLDSRVKLIEINLLNPNEFKKIDKDYDWVIHLAAINGTDNFYKNNELVFEVGFKSIINIYEYFKYSNTSLIIASSAEVYQTPSISKEFQPHHSSINPVQPPGSNTHRDSENFSTT